MIKSSFGYFDKDGTEFVVTEYDTAIPLINYYWNESFILPVVPCSSCTRNAGA